LETIMSTKLSIAALKRMLPVGAEFTAEFCCRTAVIVRGNLGTTTHFVPQPDDLRISRRRVVKQTSQMVSEYLTGPKQGQQIYCQWTGTTARRDASGDIVLTNTQVDPPEDFLRIRAITARAILAPQGAAT
jgi:hypothetical protein